MQKKGKKQRDIKFYSQKNDSVIIVHTERELRYAKKLEENIEISRYEYGKPLERAVVDKIQHVKIRKAYLQEDWLTDFYFINRQGEISVREMTTTNALAKLSEVEKLELSRRYWQFLSITDWELVI